jgi:hypothetical protein
VQQVQLDGKKALRLRFLRSKNDQEGSGRDAYLISDGTMYDPVMILETYFKRCGYLMGVINNDNNWLIPTVRILKFRGRNIQVADGSRSVGDATALKDLRELCAKMAYLEPVSTKSAKVQGVSDAFRAGLSAEQVADKGGWKAERSVHFYRKNHDSYTRRVAESNTLAADGKRPAQQERTPALPRGPFHEPQEHAAQEEVYKRGQEQRCGNCRTCAREGGGLRRTRLQSDEEIFRPFVPPGRLERVGDREVREQPQVMRREDPARPRTLSQFHWGVQAWRVQPGVEVEEENHMIITID